MKQDVYQEVTDQIIAELDKGAAPWVQPWKASGLASIPHNVTSKRAYSGTNVLLLWLVSASRGYQAPGFLTYKQAQELGGNVRKGEKGARVVYTNTFKKEVQDANGETKEERFGFLKTYTVFNVEQCDGLPAEYTPKPEEPRPALIGNDGSFDRFVSATGAVIRHKGDKAFYVPSQDFVQMPHALDFDGAASYKATLLHELGHWTGHASRLNRDLRPRFQTQSYAAEELIAELTAAFLCAHLGVKGELRHAGYIDHWSKLLKSDKRAIFTAAARAQEASDFLRAFSEKSQEPMAEAA